MVSLNGKSLSGEDAFIRTHMNSFFERSGILYRTCLVDLGGCCVRLFVTKDSADRLFHETHGVRNFWIEKFQKNEKGDLQLMAGTEPFCFRTARPFFGLASVLTALKDLAKNTLVEGACTSPLPEEKRAVTLATLESMLAAIMAPAREDVGDPHPFPAQARRTPGVVG